MKTSSQIEKSVVVDLAAHHVEKQAESFVAQIAQEDPTLALRQQALKNFKKLGLPNIRHEDWKYTDLQGLVSQKFNLQTAQQISPVQSEQKAQIQSHIDNILDSKENMDGINKNLGESTNKNILVVVDGIYNQELSVLSSNLAAKNSDIANYLGSLKEFIGLALKDSDYSDRAGSANDSGNLALKKILNLHLAEHAVYNLINATWLDGLVINLSDYQTKHYIHILHVDSGTNSHHMINNKHVCLLQQNVCLELTQEYLSLPTSNSASVANSLGPVNHNVAFDIVLQNNAQCKHYILQGYKADNFHLATYYIEQGENSEYSNYNFNFGGKLSRQDIIINHAGDHATTSLYGLALPHNTQHMDSHLKVYHNSSHGKSLQDYRYVLADRGHGVFNGMVYVAEDTVANHAEQSNKNVLLSTHAQIDTKPELQIYSDDVTCRHGATIGKLDELSLFYLQARGIDKISAKKLLVLAFIQHIGELVGDDHVACWLETQLNSIIDKI